MPAREDVLREILTTEHSYVRQLSKLESRWQRPLKKLDAAGAEQLFGDEVSLISSLHRQLLDHLIGRLIDFSSLPKQKKRTGTLSSLPNVFEAALLEPENARVADIFFKFGPFLKLYKKFCARHDRALAFAEKASAVKKLMKKQNKTAREPLTLSGLRRLMIAPVQRLPRYILLLSELLRHTASDHADYGDLQAAVALLRTNTEWINAVMRQEEQRLREQELVSKIRGVAVDSLGKLLKYGQVEKYSSKLTGQLVFSLDEEVPHLKEESLLSTQVPRTSLSLLLFDRFLLLCHKTDTERLTVRTCLPLGQVTVRDLAHATCFLLRTCDKTVLLQAETAQEKIKWLKAFRTRAVDAHDEIGDIAKRERRLLQQHFAPAAKVVEVEVRVPLCVDEDTVRMDNEMDKNMDQGMDQGIDETMDKDRVHMDEDTDELVGQVRYSTVRLRQNSVAFGAFLLGEDTADTDTVTDRLVCDRHGLTPLHWAVLGGHAGLVTQYLRRAPSAEFVHQRTRTRHYRLSALELAVWARDVSVVSALLHGGALPYVQSDEGKSAAYVSLSGDFLPEEAGRRRLVVLKDAWCRPFLHWLCCRHEELQVSFPDSVALARETLNVDVGESRQAPSHTADVRILRCFLEVLKQSNVKGLLWHVLQLRDHAGRTALHVAALNERSNALQFLLEYCPPQDKRALLCQTTPCGATALHLAARHGALSCVSLLLRHGACANIRDDHMCTPLHLCSGEESALTLLMAGARVGLESETFGRSGERLPLSQRSVGQRAWLQLECEQDDSALPESTPREQWQPDASSAVCPACDSIFAWFSRRHHCRLCGMLVCGDCSQKRVRVQDEARPVRCCDMCFVSIAYGLR